MKLLLSIADIPCVLEVFKGGIYCLSCKQEKETNTLRITSVVFNILAIRADCLQKALKRLQFDTYFGPLK